MATHPFLSDEWIDAARAIREGYDTTGATPPPPVKANLVITEVPFGEGKIDAHIDTSSAELELDTGHLEGADATLTVDYATAKAMFVDGDPQVAMQSFMAGKIKIQGDMAKVMMLMQSMQPDPGQIDLATKMATDIAAITE